MNPAANRRRAISAKLRALVLSRDGSRCLMCGAKAGDPGVRLQVDHVVSVDEGGADDLENLATLCQKCNRGKSNMKLKDYRSLYLLPDGLREAFKFFHDPPPGDYQRFHLYLYFLNRSDDVPRSEKFHHTWDISGTEWETSPDQEALKNRRRAEEAEKFEQDIRRLLAASATRLIRDERGLQRIRA